MKVFQIQILRGNQHPKSTWDVGGQAGSFIS